jgi:hypothetical protein
LDWDPRLARRNQVESEEAGNAAVIEAGCYWGSGSEDEDDEDNMGSGDEDEVNVEGVLVNGQPHPESRIDDIILYSVSKLRPTILYNP